MQILLIVTVAAGSIMLTSQLPILLAAITSLFIITETGLLVHDQHLSSAAFLASGLLGCILFITAFFIQTLAKRIRGAQQIAAQRAIDVSQLQLLNRQILQSMRTGVLVTNSSGYLQMANAAASELLGNEKLSGSFQQVGTQVLPSILMMQLKQWQSSPQYHTPPFRATETGPELQASFSSLGSKRQGDILIFIENNYLVAQRAQQLKLASLGRLTASIAHEIRNPLSAISHAAQLLNESETLDEADKKLSNIIQKHSQRMDKVIENVLELSRRNPPKLERICLNDWLVQLIQDIKQEYKDPIAITLRSPEQRYDIKTDPSQLSQVINNLTQNGLRYSLKNTGKATLTFDISINQNTQLPVLDIIDDGIGIDEQARANLFEPFYTTEAKGTGLGLYISRELCEANQARLDYITTKEGKSCFRISFPHPDRRLSPE
jgi:two-component system sensor histidine kinase PilS (NtrC family)